MSPGAWTPLVVISSGEYSSCAVLANGAVRCWGSNAAGQLGGVVCLDGSKMDPAHKGPVPKPKMIWQFNRNTRFGLSSLGYADGRVYMANDGGEMYCLDGKTGRQLWSYDEAGMDDIAVCNGFLVLANNWALHVFASKTGTDRDFGSSGSESRADTSDTTRLTAPRHQGGRNRCGCHGKRKSA
jgi:hypothetical protein